jgi:hypothetical protein
VKYPRYEPFVNFVYRYLILFFRFCFYDEVFFSRFFFLRVFFSHEINKTNFFSQTVHAPFLLHMNGSVFIMDKTNGNFTFFSNPPVPLTNIASLCGFVSDDKIGKLFYLADNWLMILDVNSGVMTNVPKGDNYCDLIVV